MDLNKLSVPGLVLDLASGNPIGRYNVSGTVFNSIGSFDTGGVLNNWVGTSSVGTGFDVPSTVPIAGNPAITVGSAWHFRAWYRECVPAAGPRNFSNGLSVTF